MCINSGGGGGLGVVLFPSDFQIFPTVNKVELDRSIIFSPHTFSPNLSSSLFHLYLVQLSDFRKSAIFHNKPCHVCTTVYVGSVFYPVPDELDYFETPHEACETKVYVSVESPQQAAAHTSIL